MKDCPIKIESFRPMKISKVGQKWRGFKSRFATECLTDTEKSAQLLKICYGQYTFLQALKSELCYESSASQFRASVMSLLLIVRNREVKALLCLNW